MPGGYFRTDEGHCDNGAYKPTEEEIAAGCAAVQSQWSDYERAKRAGKTDPDAPWNPPVVPLFQSGLPDDNGEGESAALFGAVKRGTKKETKR